MRRRGGLAARVVRAPLLREATRTAYLPHPMQRNCRSPSYVPSDVQRKARPQRLPQHRPGCTGLSAPFPCTPGPARARPPAPAGDQLRFCVLQAAELRDIPVSGLYVRSRHPKSREGRGRPTAAAHDDTWGRVSGGTMKPGSPEGQSFQPLPVFIYTGHRQAARPRTFAPRRCGQHDLQPLGGYRVLPKPCGRTPEALTLDR